MPWHNSSAKCKMYLEKRELEFVNWVEVGVGFLHLFHGVCIERIARILFILALIEICKSILQNLNCLFLLLIRNFK